MMFRSRLRAGLAHIGQALREPEAFTLRWHREGAPYAWWVFAALALTAIAGTLSYGLTLGILGGPRRGHRRRTVLRLRAVRLLGRPSGGWVVGWLTTTTQPTKGGFHVDRPRHAGCRTVGGGMANRRSGGRRALGPRSHGTAAERPG